MPATVDLYERDAHRDADADALPSRTRRTYTAVVMAGVKDTAGNPTTADFTWTFTTTAPPPPPPTQGPGGPVLVVTAAANPFTTYYAEILRGEGANRVRDAWTSLR